MKIVKLHENSRVGKCSKVSDSKISTFLHAIKRISTYTPKRNTILNHTVKMRWLRISLMQEIAYCEVTNDGPTKIWYTREIHCVHGNKDYNRKKQWCQCKLTEWLASFKSQSNIGVRTGTDVLSFSHITHTYMYMIFHTQKLKFKENSVSRKSKKLILKKESKQPDIAKWSN